MRQEGFRLPPFELDRTRWGDLARQIADALRHAITTGYYCTGDVLPPVRDLARLLDVSKGVAEQAIARLREERLIAPRPRIGSVVCAKDRPLWKGQVLIIVPGGDSIRYETMMAGVVRDALTDAGYLPLIAAVRDMGSDSPDFSLLEAQIRQQIDLVVQIVGTKKVLSWLEHKGIPFVTLSSFTTQSASCVWHVRRSWDLATADFVAHCRERKVKNVLLVSAWKETMGAIAALKRVGIAAKEWRLDRTKDVPGVKDICDIALNAFAERFAREGRGWLPDLILFADDNLTTGALQAMLAEGVRIPGDVSVVTWANRWEGPTYAKPFTRLEMDAIADGRLLAEGALEYLSKGVHPKSAVIGPRYVRGETF